MNTIQLDDYDRGIVSERVNQRRRLRGIQCGDFIRDKAGKFSRVTHVWPDGAQTGGFSEGGECGSFYLCDNGALSYSGRLDPALPLTHLRRTHESKPGRAWIFHHNSAGAGRGVDCSIPCAVWELLDDSEAIDRTKPSRWIINPAGHKGAAQSNTYTTFDGVERVAYRNGQTLESYLVENPTYFVITDSDFTARLKAYEESQVTAPQEITEERFFELLECLPPERWETVRGVEMFHICERISGRLVQWAAKLSGRYCAFVDRDNVPADAIAAKVAAFFASDKGAA